MRKTSATPKQQKSVNSRILNSSRRHSLHHLGFDKSIQASIIFTVSEGRILAANRAACKLLGYSHIQLLSKRRAAIFDINESSFKKMLSQITSEGQSSDLLRVIKNNGKLLVCGITSRTFKDKDGIEKVITSITNLSQTKMNQKYIDSKKEKIVASNIIIAQAKSDARQEKNIEWKKHTGKTSYDVMWEWDLITGQIYVSESIEEVFGYKVQNNIVNFSDFKKKLLPAQKDAIEKKILKALVSDKIWSDSFMFKRRDGSIASATSRARIIRDEKGTAICLIGAMQDVSRLEELGKKLDQEIKLKQKQISEAEEDAKEAERSEIGKELHDNVNQLLSASKLYLEIGKEGGKDSKMFLNRSSEYTINAIEEIRKLTKGLTSNVISNLGLCEAIGSVTRDIMEVNPVKINCVLKTFKEDSVDDKFKLNAFRIVQEQLNNILKHAKATKVIITLSQNKQFIILSISDNGVGFDTSQKRKGIGVANILDRAATYNGTIELVSQHGKGCSLTVTFPVHEVH